MLFIASVEKWEGIGKGYRVPPGETSVDFILNTENLYKIQSRATTESKAFYHDNPWDRRKSAGYIELGDTVASVRAAFDRTFASNYITLPVYEDDDTTVATTDRDIPVKTITRAQADSASSDRSYVWYNEGSKEIRVLVNYTLQEIIDVADSGTTSTS